MPSEARTKGKNRSADLALSSLPEHSGIRKDTGLWQLSHERRLSKDLIDSLRNPEFWMLSAWLDIVVTYRRSRLGALWLLMPSAVYIWGVGSVFAGLWGVSIAHFAAHLALGWTVFTVMHSVTVQSTGVLYGARSFIMDGRMRLTDFVLRSMAKSVFHFLMALPMTAVALALYPHVQPLGLLVGFGALLIILVNTFTAGMIFALAGARYPDIQEVVNNVFRVLFLLTPIIWYPSKMPATSPRGLASRLNPFYHLIEIFRAPILGEPIGMSSWYYVGALTIVGVVLAILLYRRYARLVPIWL
jgi:homopolymeric O-antigen transport system permease protein